MSKAKQKLQEAKEVLHDVRVIVYDLLDEPMTDAQKKKVLELVRLLK